MATQQWKTPPAMQIDAKKNYRVKMETDKGMITLELYPQYAPKTVNNFIFNPARLLGRRNVSPGDR
jgi:peptidyl-prolyl cis-trans isomerase B (cyclophilin B)